MVPTWFCSYIAKSQILYAWIINLSINTNFEILLRILPFSNYPSIAITRLGPKFSREF